MREHDAVERVTEPFQVREHHSLVADHVTALQDDAVVIGLGSAYVAFFFEKLLGKLRNSLDNHAYSKLKLELGQAQGSLTFDRALVVGRILLRGSVAFFAGSFISLSLACPNFSVGVVHQ